MLTLNWNLDCTGVCGGPFHSDSCGICQLPDIIEHRDCQGVCFGAAILDECGVCHEDPLSPLVDSSLDTCGVCGGSNTTCLGCDRVPASGTAVDSCGVCGGNDCGCFRIDSIDPSWGPKSGGTEITIRGAGFFFNDSGVVDFDPQSDNCGAPREIGGEFVSATCRFESGQNNDITADDVTIINQSTIRCITKATTADLVFQLTVSIANGPQSNSLIFRYYDNNLVRVAEISPVDTGLDQFTNITLHGQNFDNTGSLACFLYDIESCNLQLESSNGEAPLVIPANYISESQVVCTLPSATTPCQVRVQLSQDGQRSGLLTFDSDLLFTYRYSAPLVERVQFSRDLSNLLVQFDRSVQLGPSNTAPTCSEVFSPTSLDQLGGSEASCYWLSSSQDVLTVDLPPSALITIHSSLTFRNSALLTRGQDFSFAVSDSETFPVDSGTDYTIPVAIVDGPRTIPACGNVQFTGIHSLHPGYGGLSYHWSVTTEDSTTPHYQDILNYLDSLDANTYTLSLSSDWFVTGVSYYLHLMVVNSVGAVSSPSITHLLKEEREEPQVFIRGSNERVVREGEGVLLEAEAFVPYCFSSSPAPHFSFQWELYQLVDERRAIFASVDISMLPTASPVLYLPPSLLSPSSHYLSALTLHTFMHDELSDTVNVSISVIPTRLHAVIHGGDRVLSVNRALILDARESVYDLVSQTTPTFSWSCNVIGSGEPCYNLSQPIPTPILIPHSDIVLIPDSTMEQGLEYNFTVELSQSGSGKSHSSVAVSVTSAMPPIVEVVTVGEGEYVTSHEAVIRGLVYSATPLLSTSWESLEIEGEC